MSTATVPEAPTNDIKTYRGESLEELLPKIREELGADAVILRQRDGLRGGVGGFFQKRCVEVEARAGSRRVDTYAGGGEDEARAALDGGEPQDAMAGEERFSRLAEEIAEEGEMDAATDAAFAEGMQAPAIRALFDAASPFAQKLEEADAALPKGVEAALPESLRSALQAPSEPALPGPFADLFRTPVAPAPSAIDAPSAPAVPPQPPVEPAVADPGPAVTGDAALPAGTAEPALAAAATGAEPDALPARPTNANTQEIALVEGGMTPSMAADLISETVSHLLPFGSPRGVKRLARVALARRIPVQGPRRTGAMVMAFAGAGGSGKTLTAARMAAAYAARSDLPVVVVALSPRDGGAELRSLLEPAGVEVQVCATAADARVAIAEAGDRAMVIVDTPAVSPGNPEAVKALAAQLRRIKVSEVHACMPATLSAASAGRALAALAPLRPAGMVLTHVDETPQVGAVVELSISSGVPLTFVGSGTDLEDGLELADPAAVAALVLS
jgi:flagellar biosynthesis GTPase FlhF